MAAAVAGSAVLAAVQAPRSVETFDAAWRIVRDSHFDKTLNGVDWNAVEAELRPKAAGARTAGELRAILADMLGRLGQSHFAVIPSTADGDADEYRDLTGSPGFEVRLVGRDLLVTSVDHAGAGAAAGVRPGWSLQVIDSVTVSRMLDAVPDPLHPSRRQVEAWRLAQNRLRGPAGTKVAITFEDGTGKSVQVLVDRRKEPGQPVKVGNLPTMFVRLEAGRAETPLGRSAGVIAFNVWMAAVDPLFQKAVDDFRGADGIIIDLRGNPGGLAAMLMGISGHFIDQRKPLGVMKTRENELRFNVNPRRVNASGQRVAPFAGPVAILVDGLSGSASECFAGGMQSLDRVRVFGQQTMGQALPALFSRLPNGDVLIHAYGDFVTADGTRLEGRGVIPDEVVPLEREHLLGGRDAPKDAALAWIDRAVGEETAARAKGRH
jgi:carboxyl-terminal processing protease